MRPRIERGGSWRLLLTGLTLAMAAVPPAGAQEDVVYSTFLGGSREEVAEDIAMDAAGNAWITGWTYSPDFPKKGAGITPRPLGIDVFVVKLDPQGRLLWSTLVGGSGDDQGQAIAVHASGHAYVAGLTASRDFPRVRAIQGPSRQLVDAVVFELSPSGDSFVYSTYLGGSDEDQGEAIAVDPEGHAYVVGRTYSTDLPVVNAFQPENGGNLDVYVAKIAPGGGALDYLTYLGGSSYELRMGVAADPRGNAYVTGLTGSPDFPVVNALQPHLRGLDDGFVTKIAPDGSGPVFSTYFGGSSSDFFQGVDVDADGSVYLTGASHSADFPVTGAVQPALHGVNDVVVTRLAPDGQEVVWSTFLGGGGEEWGSDIAVDARGSAYVTGFTDSADFPSMDPVWPACGTSGRCATQAFLTQIASDGSALVRSTTLGPGFGNGVDVDARGAAAVAGGASPGFPTVNAFQPQYGGGFLEGFAVKVAAANRPPECGIAFASPAVIWPPNGRLVTVSVRGVVDPDGGPVRIAVSGIRQDEPNRPGAPGASGVGSSTARVRATRLGTGDGRVYHLLFEATDSMGASCAGEVTVCVPHDRRPGATCGDGGALYDATAGR